MALLEFDDEPANRAKIKVIGVGGGGGNAVNTMIESRPRRRRLHRRQHRRPGARGEPGAASRSQLGSALTKGLGAGANPEIGRNAALEDITKLTEVLAGADMVFVTAGMGGGTGTGAAPVIAQIARELRRAHRRRRHQAVRLRGQASAASRPSEGIAELQARVDTLITIPNERLLSLAGQKTTLLDAFRKADEVLLNAVQGICDLITVPGLINVDFADVRTIMTDMGRALMGTGRAVRRAPRHRGGAAGHQLAAARGRLHQRRHRHPHQHHRRPRPDAARGQRGLDADPGGGARGREHHLRLGHRRQLRRRGAHHRHRHRLRSRGRRTWKIRCRTRRSSASAPRRSRCRTPASRRRRARSAADGGRRAHDQQVELKAQQAMRGRSRVPIRRR